jgi:hypothetical protein
MQKMNQRPSGVIITITVIVTVTSLLFLFWAPLHLGVEIPLGFRTFAEPTIFPAFVVESVCGLALAISAVALYTRRRWAWNALFVAHIVAFVGVLQGLTALALGRGPRTMSNDLYHNVLLLLLVTDLILLQRPGVWDALTGRE